MSQQANPEISVFLVDNFDSFTYNLVDELRTMGLSLQIYRNSVPADVIFAKMSEHDKHSQV
ncbi:MAG: anthranilate synthase component 2 [Paraglaciecola sp.]|jgi:anthranilate synthase component 2